MNQSSELRKIYYERLIGTSLLITIRTMLARGRNPDWIVNKMREQHPKMLESSLSRFSLAVEEAARRIASGEDTSQN